MVSSASARDKLRLQHQLDPCSGAWLNPIHSVSIGLSFATPEFQVLFCVGGSGRHGDRHHEIAAHATDVETQWTISAIMLFVAS